MARSKEHVRKKLMEKYKIDEADVTELETLFDGDLGEVATQLKSASIDLEKWSTWYKDNKPAIETNEKLAQDAVTYRKQLEALEKAGFKVGDPNPDLKKSNFSDFDPEEFGKDVFNASTGTAAQIAKEMTTCGLRYFKDFGEILDSDELEKVIKDKGLTVKQAFEVMTKGRYEEKSKADEETRIKKAVDERVEAELTKRSAPRISSEPSFLSEYIKRGNEEKPKILTREEEYAAFVNDLRNPNTANH